MATRRDDLTREAARLFAERGFHGTSMGDLAEALGVQKGSLYSLTGSKQELLFETMREGARVPRGARRVPRSAPAVERIRARAPRPPPRRRRAARRRDRLHAGVALPRGRVPRRDPRRAAPVRGALARLFREGVESGGLRTDLDAGAATLLVLSAANWAYTWLEPGRDTDELADRFTAILVDGIRGYATPHGVTAVLIVNPFATGGRRAPARGRAGRAPAAGSRRVLTTAAGEATDDRARGRAVDAIYVFGGDGTYNEVLNGIGVDVPLGFLPGGGTSVLPRALGLPRDPVEAAQRVAEGRTRASGSAA